MISTLLNLSYFKVGKLGGGSPNTDGNKGSRGSVDVCGKQKVEISLRKWPKRKSF